MTSAATSTSPSPACLHSASSRASSNSLVSLATPGSTSLADAQKVPRSFIPPEKSQVVAPTTPPGQVTRRISATPASGSSMKCRTSCASAASNESSDHGRSSAAARFKSAPGTRSAQASSRGDGSAPATWSAPTRRASSSVRTPEPQPTSRMRCGGSTLAKSANAGASSREERPMKRSYALPETSKLIRGIHVGEQRRVNLDLPRLELVERLAQGERAGGEAALECGQGRLPERGRERPRLGDGGVGAGLRQLAQQTGRDERRVDGEHDRELRGRGPQARDDPGQRRT